MIAYTFEQGGLHYVWSYETDSQIGKAHDTKAKADHVVNTLNSKSSSKWVDAQQNPPLEGRDVIVKFGDGTITAGYISDATVKHKAHGEEWPVYNCLKGGSTFGVIGWQPLPGE